MPLDPDQLVPVSDLVSSTDIANRLGVVISAISKWRKRYPDFPTPVVFVVDRPFFLWSEVSSWYESKDWGRPYAEQEIVDILTVYVNEGPLSAAEKSAVAISTVGRWARDRSVVYEPPQVHGTRHSFEERGCRCDVCVLHHPDLIRVNRAAMKARAETDAPHGTSSGYNNWGCRCEPCKKVGSEDNKNQRERRKNRQSSAE